MQVAVNNNFGFYWSDHLVPLSFLLAISTVVFFVNLAATAATATSTNNSWHSQNMRADLDNEAREKEKERKTSTTTTKHLQADRLEGIKVRYNYVVLSWWWTRSIREPCWCVCVDISIDETMSLPATKYLFIFLLSSPWRESHGDKCKQGFHFPNR